MTEPEETEPEAELTELMVRYVGRADVRLLSRRDLSGDGTANEDVLEWQGNGSDITWADFEEFAGSEERAKEMYAKLKDEFQLVGPGAEEAETLEFEVGGQVEEQ